MSAAESAPQSQPNGYEPVPLSNPVLDPTLAAQLGFTEEAANFEAGASALTGPEEHVEPLESQITTYVDSVEQYVPLSVDEAQELAAQNVSYLESLQDDPEMSDVTPAVHESLVELAQKGTDFWRNSEAEKAELTDVVKADSFDQLSDQMKSRATSLIGTEQATDEEKLMALQANSIARLRLSFDLEQAAQPEQTAEAPKAAPNTSETPEQPISKQRKPNESATSKTATTQNNPQKAAPAKTATEATKPVKPAKQPAQPAAEAKPVAKPAEKAVEPVVEPKAPEFALSDFVTVDANDKGHRSNGQFLSGYEKDVIEANAELIRNGVEQRRVDYAKIIAAEKRNRAVRGPLYERNGNDQNPNVNAAAWKTREYGVDPDATYDANTKAGQRKLARKAPEAGEADAADGVPEAFRAMGGTAEQWNNILTDQERQQFLANRQSQAETGTTTQEEPTPELTETERRLAMLEKRVAEKQSLSEIAASGYKWRVGSEELAERKREKKAHGYAEKVNVGSTRAYRLGSWALRFSSSPSPAEKTKQAEAAKKQASIDELARKRQQRLERQVEAERKAEQKKAA